LGSAFAALLARGGIPIVAACRAQAHRAAIESAGLLLREGEHEQRVQITVDSVLPREQAYAAILVLVKAFDTEAAAKSLAWVSSETPVLTLQNGLGNAETLAANLHPEQILLGATIFGALLEEPGAVRVTGRGDCEIGAPRPQGERFLPSIKDLLARGGIECRFSPNVSATVWKKVAVNAVVNPLTALLRVPNGDLLEHPELEPLFASIVEEVWAVAARCGVALPTPPELASEVRRACQVTAENRSSMLRDIEQRRRTEIEAINGAVARLGREHGRLAPVNEALAALISAMQGRPGEKA
jgi:2-dehydropantoate 2-reductase